MGAVKEWARKSLQKTSPDGMVSVTVWEKVL
jgi:hypothetical protein